MEANPGPSWICSWPGGARAFTRKRREGRLPPVKRTRLSSCLLQARRCLQCNDSRRQGLGHVNGCGQVMRDAPGPEQQAGPRRKGCSVTPVVVTTVTASLRRPGRGGSQVGQRLSTSCRHHCSELLQSRGWSWAQLGEPGPSGFQRGDPGQVSESL